MNLRFPKTLAAIVAAGAIAFGLGGCNELYPQYLFNGNIGDEKVIYSESFFFSNIYLKVIRKDGTTITYKDFENSDLKIERVIIEKDGVETEYFGDVLGKSVIEEAQKQFDDYLNKILAIKQEEGMVNIKKP